MRRRTPLIAVAALVAASTLGLSLASRRRPPSGLVEGMLRPCPPTPNCVSSQAELATQRIEPLRYAGNPSEAFARLVGLVAGRARTRLLHHEDGYAHFEVTTLMLRFKDDLELFLDEGEGVIHVRSCSRVGRSDLGTNRARVEQIRAAFEGG